MARAIGVGMARDEFWVFGYGSLMWRPGFAFKARERARLHGFHRSLCIYSWHHRGTEERPGLVLGLDRGGSCLGIAFQVDAADWPATVDYLREREQITGVYVERRLAVGLQHQQRTIEALTYIVDREHDQYAGVLPIEEQAAIVSGARGKSGDNDDYVLNTLAHMHEEGIRDTKLSLVRDKLR